MIDVVVGDLTTQEVDAIVNAANESLAPGGGVCGGDPARRGRRDLRGVRNAGRLRRPGDAKATRAVGSLPLVVHAVGPVWRGGDVQEAELLASAHRRALEVAESLGCRTIAFPALSTGIYEATRRNAPRPQPSRPF